jgi:DNA-binding response OmpR family regulator
MPGTLAGKFILLLEDESSAASPLMEALTSAQARAVCVHSSADALLVLQSFVVDLAVLNFAAGDGDCRNVARKCQDIGLPFIACAFDQGADDVRAAAYLRKPFSVDDLMFEINLVLGRKLHS